MKHTNKSMNCIKHCSVIMIDCALQVVYFIIIQWNLLFDCVNPVMFKSEINKFNILKAYIMHMLWKHPEQNKMLTKFFKF
jgi:hypothetical protein